MTLSVLRSDRATHTLKLPLRSLLKLPLRHANYALEQERRHGLAEAVAEYDRLINVYPSLGDGILVLPKVSVAERADWLLNLLAR